jgi:hypothetical protein
MQQVITRTSEIILGKDGILRTKIFEGAEIELRDVQEYYAFTEKLTGGQKALVLIDGRTAFTITEEARSYASVQANRTRIATALIVGSPAARMLYNLYMQVNRPQTPTRMFTDEQSATAWLFSFKTR